MLKYSLSLQIWHTFRTTNAEEDRDHNKNAIQDLHLNKSGTFIHIIYSLSMPYFVGKLCRRYFVRVCFLSALFVGSASGAHYKAGFSKLCQKTMWEE